MPQIASDLPYFARANYAQHAPLMVLANVTRCKPLKRFTRVAGYCCSNVNPENYLTDDPELPLAQLCCLILSVTQNFTSIFFITIK